MKIIILGLSLLIFASNALSATLATKEDAKKLAKDVMAQIGKGNMEAGVRLTQPYITVPEHEFHGMLDQMKMQGPAISQRFGKTLSVEVAAVEEVGESLMLVMYLQKFERHVLRWKFYYYKPDQEWTLNTFDDQMEAMFQNK